MDALLGAELLQVCFGQNEIIMNFTKDVAIIVMSDLEVITNGSRMRGEFAALAGPLLGLIGAEIAQIYPEGSRKLCIGFSSKAEMLLIDDSDSFESYVISAGGKRYVI